MSKKEDMKNYPARCPKCKHQMPHANKVCTKCGWKEKWKNPEADWHQAHVSHCPEKGCKGMLLQSIYYHEEHCTDCKKYFMGILTYTKTTNPEKKKIFDNDT